MNELILKVEDYNIEPSRAEQIRAIFIPMANMLEGFETQYNEVVQLEPSKETSSRAKRLRLDIAKVRINTEKLRVAQKEEYLRAGKAIDGVANILKFAVVEKENKLQEIETHFERLEAARISKLAEDRAIELEKYECFNVPNLGIMDEAVYSNFLVGAKANFETRKEAERKAEEERLAKEAAELAERKRVWFENERLKQEAQEREKQLQEERRLAEIERQKQEAALAIERAKAESERKAVEEANRIEKEKLEAEKKAIEEKNRIERERAEAEARRIKAEQEATLERERAERAKLELELRAKAEAEAKEKARIAREEKKARTAPDRDKLESLAKTIDNLELPSVSSDDAIKTIEDVKGLLVKVSAFIRQRNQVIGE